jgi:hypothetical protein
MKHRWKLNLARRCLARTVAFEESSDICNVGTSDMQILQDELEAVPLKKENRYAQFI